MPTDIRTDSSHKRRQRAARTYEKVLTCSEKGKYKLKDNALPFLPGRWAKPRSLTTAYGEDTLRSPTDTLPSTNPQGQDLATGHQVRDAQPSGPVALLLRII